MWRPAILLYTISTPLVWMSLISFYSTTMSRDILCTLAQLGDKKNSAEFNIIHCTANPPQSDMIDGKKYNYSAEELKEDANWRWVMFQMGIIVPCCLNTLEICMNRVRLSYKNPILVFIFSLIYLIINMFGSFTQYARIGTVVYPDLLEWERANNKWTELFMYMLILLTGAPVLSLIFVKIHNVKADCKWAGSQVREHTA